MSETSEPSKKKRKVDDTTTEKAEGNQENGASDKPGCVDGVDDAIDNTDTDTDTAVCNKCNAVVEKKTLHNCTGSVNQYVVCDIALCKDCFATHGRNWLICPMNRCRDDSPMCKVCAEYEGGPVFECMECHVSTGYCCIDTITCTSCNGRESMCYKCSDAGGGFCSGCNDIGK